MPSPKVSFVIPAYNNAAWLPHAIESCQKQEYSNFEIVVVDDASTDTTRDLMKFLASKDGRIKYIDLVKNVGRSEARNMGNEAAQGKYILVLDADDLAYTMRARLSVKELERCEILHGSCEYMNVLGHKLGTHNADVFNAEKAMREGLNRIVHSTMAYTREIALKHPYRSGELSDLGLDDWAFQLDARGYKWGVVPQVIGAYREMGTGISARRDPKRVSEVKKAFLAELQGVPA